MTSKIRRIGGSVLRIATALAVAGSIATYALYYYPPDAFPFWVEFLRLPARYEGHLMGTAIGIIVLFLLAAARNCDAGEPGA